MSTRTEYLAEAHVNFYLYDQIKEAERAVMRELEGETNHTIPMKNAIVSEYNNLLEMVDPDGDRDRVEVFKGRIRRKNH